MSKISSNLKLVLSRKNLGLVGVFLSTILVVLCWGVWISSATAHTPGGRAAQLFERGEELYEAGQFAEAAAVWGQAADAYAQKGNREGTAQSEINQAEALQELGHYPQACNTLLQAFRVTTVNCWKLIESGNQQDSWLKTIEQQPNSLTKAIGLRSLGNVLQKLDKLELSGEVLQLSLSEAQKLSSKSDESAALMSLGNTYQARGDRELAVQDFPPVDEATPWRCVYRPALGAPKKFYQQAAAFYQQAASASVLSATWIEAQTNHLSTLLETDALSDALELWPQIQSRLKDVPSSRSILKTPINLAMTLTCLRQSVTTDAPNWREIAQILATTVQQARSLGDQRTESYAIGYLGGLYAQAQSQPPPKDLAYAQELTRQALILAQAIEAPDIAYLWQWQLGYLLKVRGDFAAAIAAYNRAVDTLQSIGSNLSAASPNIQFSWRASVEPVYRQLVALLLQPKQVSQKNLKKARDVIEALQVAELENLLGCNLLVAPPVPIDQTGEPKAAVIYPIILADRLEVILSLPNQSLHHYSNPLPKGQNLDDLLGTLRQNLQTPHSVEPGLLKLSRQVYGWLVQPAEGELEKNRVKTLVFVLDGALRNIPMAALYDGQQYLIEKYAVAVSPSLQLLQPQPLSAQKLEVLAAGISQQIPNFPAPPLPEVKDELTIISETTKSVVLRNQDFTRSALENKINERPFSVVHLATHGRFSSQPNQTYIRAWDGPINPNQLKLLLQSREQSQPNPIELLVLSACDTAEGDKQSALGLAGVAVRAGARSTLASLWQVKDDSTTEFIAQFYKTLANPNSSTVTLAKALQSAQLELLYKSKTPFQWAAYVLVGNWL